MRKALTTLLALAALAAVPASAQAATETATIAPQETWSTANFQDVGHVYVVSNKGALLADFDPACLDLPTRWSIIWRHLEFADRPSRGDMVVSNHRDRAVSIVVTHSAGSC